MEKSTERRLLEIDPKMNTTLHEPEAEPFEEDSWVIVKKQRINILIPPLSTPSESTTPNLESTQIETMVDTNLQMPPNLESIQIEAMDTSLQMSPNLESIQIEAIYTGLQMPPVEDSEKSVPLNHEKDSLTVPKSPQPVVPSGKLPRVEDRMRSEYPVEDRFRCRDTLRVHNSLRIRKKPTGSIDRCMLLTPKMRATNIEKKLLRAGGLNPWLASLGLEKFVEIFHGKRVSKFQLVNLTMKKLKDMGVEAVGPRRKLMHAIDCLREPNCFKGFVNLAPRNM